MALSEKQRSSTKLTEALVLARTRAADLESVRKLNCWASHIEDASIVRQMPNLEVCSLSVNSLTSLRDFAHCQSLQELYIRKNQVEELTDVLYLQKLERLRVLWLSDNPCSQGDNYRMTVLRTLPNLQKLDNVAVTEEEINKALEEGDDLTESEEDGGGLKSDIPNTNTNAIPSPQDTSQSEPATTTAASVTNCHSTSAADTSSDNADDKEEGEDSGVEAPASGFHPEPSEHGPQLVASAVDSRRSCLQESVKLSWEETNQIRTQLGLKPLPMSKVTSPKSVTTGVTKARNANILQSVLLLIRELDKDSLEIVHNTAQQRLENM